MGILKKKNISIWCKNTYSSILTFSFRSQHIRRLLRKQVPVTILLKPVAVGKVFPSFHLSLLVYKMGIWSCCEVRCSQRGCSDLRYSEKGGGANHFHPFSKAKEITHAFIQEAFS